MKSNNKKGQKQQIIGRNSYSSMAKSPRCCSPGCACPSLRKRKPSPVEHELLLSVLTLLVLRAVVSDSVVKLGSEAFDADFSDLLSPITTERSRLFV